METGQQEISIDMNSEDQVLDQTESLNVNMPVYLSQPSPFMIQTPSAAIPGFPLEAPSI